MREKMVALLRQIVIPFWAGQIADHLISNDVVPVVRCKDCRHRSDETSNGCWFCNHKMLGLIRPDDFCSYGERKREENPCDHCFSGSYRGCDGCGYAEKRDDNG